MSVAVSHRDLLLCVLARQQQLLADDELETELREWLAHPQRPLLETLAARANLSEVQLARLKSAADVAAGETCVDPFNAPLRMLPPRIRSLLVPAGMDASTIGDLTTAHHGGGETRPAPSQRGREATSSWEAQTQGLTSGDRFDILQVHAQGGLGVVFLARDREIERKVALKQIKSRWADDPDSRARFLLEARVTGKLEHPGIVPIYALGTDASGRPFYAMRLIRGESLLDVIDRFHRHRTSQLSDGERLAELRKLLQRFIDVCHAVDYAHSNGVIHRDIKPANIMLGKYGETLVVDWGLAKVIGADEDAALTLRLTALHHADSDATPTQLGAAIGTPAYMSPEQAAGRHAELTAATDVYSLGATLYQLLTGWLPHSYDDDADVMRAKVEHGSIVPPRHRASWLPRPLESICLKALSAQPGQRYASAQALAADLEQWLADEPTSAHRETWSERAFRWMRNHRTFMISFVAADLVATAAIVAGALGWNHMQAERLKLEEASHRQQAEIRERERRRLAALAVSVQSAEQSAAAELAAGRYAAAARFLRGAVETVAEDPSLQSQRDELAARQDRLQRLVTFHQDGARAEELSFAQHDAEAGIALFRALEAIQTFDHGDWWDHLPADLLTPAQLTQLQQSVYRRLILLATLHGKELFKNLPPAARQREARQVLAINELIQRFRPAESTRWLASCARLQIGQGAALEAADLAPPQNAADAYMMGGIWLIAAENPAVLQMLGGEGRDPLEICKRRLRMVDAVAPDDYWSHVLLAYVEQLEVGAAAATPLEETHAHLAAARQALSHAMAVKPDYWLAYAHRSAACRLEIEARRTVPRDDLPIEWETTDDLLRMMMHDSKRALQLAPRDSEAAWYAAFALMTAGHTELAVDALLAATTLANRYDVETTPRILDPERQLALPSVVQFADGLINEQPTDPRYRLLRGMAQLRLNNLDAAARDVDAALADVNPPPETWAARGDLRRQRRQYSDAAQDYEAALEKLPRHATALLGLGQCREATQQWRAALAIYDRAAATARTAFEGAAAQLGRCRCLLALDQTAYAIDAAKKAQRIKPSCDLESIAQAARSKGDAQLAARIDELARAPRALDLQAKRRVDFAVLPLLGGGFEGGLLDDWGHDEVAGFSWHNVGGWHSMADVDERSPHSGARSLHIVSRRSSASGYGTTAQSVPADPEARYRFTVWARAKDLAAGAVAIVIDDQFERPLVELPAGSYDWRQASGEFDLQDSQAPLREGLKNVTVRIVARGPGQAWLDDLRVELAPSGGAADADDPSAP